jgi:hypothetical protein
VLGEHGNLARKLGIASKKINIAIKSPYIIALAIMCGADVLDLMRTDFFHEVIFFDSFGLSFESYFCQFNSWIRG